jgi:hypothetical protein
MQFCLQLFDLGLANVGVEGLLHLLLELVLAFPEEDLSLTLLYLLHEIGLLFVDDVDVVLEFGGLLFHFLEFFDELALKVDILVL